jgi:hypothetical protein
MLYDMIRDAHQNAAVINRAVVIEASEIARYYYEQSAREHWSLVDDFVGFSPSWDTVFIEWRLPATIRTGYDQFPNPMAGGQIGLLMTKEPCAKQEQPDIAKIKALVYEFIVSEAASSTSSIDPINALRLVLMTPDELWEKYLDEDTRKHYQETVLASWRRTAEANITHVIDALLWLHIPPYPFKLTYHYAFPLDDTDGGRLVFSTSVDGEQHVMLSIDRTDKQSTSREELNHAKTFLHVPLLLLTMINKGDASLVDLKEYVGRLRAVIKPGVEPRA